MHRRSFFGVLFSGLLARWLPQPRGASSVHDAWFKGDDPRSRFGFTGFKPASAFKPPSPPVYHYYPLEGGLYKPGDTFSVGRRRLVSTGHHTVEVREILPGGALRP